MDCQAECYAWPGLTLVLDVFRHLPLGCDKVSLYGSLSFLTHAFSRSLSLAFTLTPPTDWRNSNGSIPPWIWSKERKLK